MVNTIIIKLLFDSRFNLFLDIYIMVLALDHTSQLTISIMIDSKVKGRYMVKSPNWYYLLCNLRKWEVKPLVDSTHTRYTTYE